MTYLTRISVDSDVWQNTGLTEPDAWKGMLWHMFKANGQKGSEPAFVFRCDSNTQGVVFTLLSAEQPDTEKLKRKAKTEVVPLPENLFAAGRNFEFVLRINPTQGRRRRRIEGDKLQEWLSERLEPYATCNVVRYSKSTVPQVVCNDGNVFHHDYFDVEGEITIKDPEGFESLVNTGIGRGKRYGFGLLLDKQFDLAGQQDATDCEEATKLEVTAKKETKMEKAENIQVLDNKDVVAAAAARGGFPFLSVSVIAAVPPSCLNRGSAGEIKTAPFGGYPRTLWSSQSQNKDFRELVRADEETGKFFRSYLTMRVEDEVKQRLLDSGIQPERADTLIEEFKSVLRPEGKKRKAKSAANGKKRNKAAQAKQDADAEGLEDKTVEDETAVVEAEKKPAIMLISDSQLNACAEKIIELDSGIIPVSDILGNTPRDGILNTLMGMMIANVAGKDACLYVQDAISTHQHMSTFDQFTAVDELDGRRSAAHIGLRELAGPIMFKTFVLDVRGLFDEHNDVEVEDKRKVMSKILEAIIFAMPSGGKAKHFARTTPIYFLITGWRASPPTMVNAFLRPIFAEGDTTVIEASVNALKSHWVKEKVANRRRCGCLALAEFEFEKGEKDILDLCDEVAEMYFPSDVGIYLVREKEVSREL